MRAAIETYARKLSNAQKQKEAAERQVRKSIRATDLKPSSLDSFKMGSHSPRTAVGGLRSSKEAQETDIQQRLHLQTAGGKGFGFLPAQQPPFKVKTTKYGHGFTSTNADTSITCGSDVSDEDAQK